MNDKGHRLWRSCVMDGLVKRGLERKKGHLHGFKLVAKLHLHILLHLCKEKELQIPWICRSRENLIFSHCNVLYLFPATTALHWLRFIVHSHHALEGKPTWTGQKSTIVNFWSEYGGSFTFWSFHVCIPYYVVWLAAAAAAAAPWEFSFYQCMFDQSMAWWALHFKSLKTLISILLLAASQLGFCWKSCSKHDQYLKFHCRLIALQVQQFRDISRPILQNPTSPDLDLFILPCQLFTFLSSHTAT